MNLMYHNLHRNGFGGFPDYSHWSSTEDNTSNALYQHFGSNLNNVFSTGTANKSYQYKVRPARSFSFQPNTSFTNFNACLYFL